MLDSIFLQGKRLAMPYFHIDAEGYSIDGDNANDISELEEFPENFQIGRYLYTKAGITFNRNNNHFVSLIRHNQEWVYYDGILSHTTSRLFKDIKEQYSQYKIVSLDYVVVPDVVI
jgi:hypothetical protein